MHSASFLLNCLISRLACWLNESEIKLKTFSLFHSSIQAGNQQSATTVELLLMNEQSWFYYNSIRFTLLILFSLILLNVLSNFICGIAFLFLYSHEIYSLALEVGDSIVSYTGNAKSNPMMYEGLKKPSW